MGGESMARRVARGRYDRAARRLAVKPELVRSGRVEFTILAGDQIVGQREARHRLEPPRPRREIRPTGDVEPAFGQEHNAASSPYIGDSEILADEERLALDGLVDK